MPARGAGAAARTVWGTCIRRAATHATGEGHTHWHRVWRGYTGPWGSRNPLQKSSSHLSPGKRCEATAQSALGWYRPSVGVPETFGGYSSDVKESATEPNRMQPAGCFPSFFRRPGPRGQFATPKNAPNVPCLPPSNERHHPATARRHPVALVRSRCRMQRQIGRFSEATDGDGRG